ncbi:MAG: Tim44/TimA family putative adaptor protein [Pikeienuella sp.]
MADGFTTILILAAVAVFLLIRLKSVLGTKTGHEVKPRSAQQRPQTAAAPTPLKVVKDDEPEETGPFAETLTAIRKVEPGFSPDEFVAGARQAYEMLLMAFENGDQDTLRRYLAPDVFQGFASVIEQRADEGLSVDARFVGLREAEITDIKFDEADNMAEIEMNFVGETITVVRDSEHHVVEGDANEIRRERDRWTFGRQMGSKDPNWLLIATDV